jgi:hypothetical protein
MVGSVGRDSSPEVGRTQAIRRFASARGCDSISSRTWLRVAGATRVLSAAIDRLVLLHPLAANGSLAVDRP